MTLGSRIGIGIALVGAVTFCLTFARLWPVVVQYGDPNRSRTFYIPAESMMPTLRINDRVRPERVAPALLKRGMVVVFNGSEGARVDRIVALGGDNVAVRAGTVVLNGTPVRARDLGQGPAQEGMPTRLLVEQLPGEQRPHRILDAGPSPGDDYGPVTVPAGMLFVLGDNRDRSADSRYPAEQQGVGLVRADAVIGVVDRLLWASGFHDLGRPIGTAGAR